MIRKTAVIGLISLIHLLAGGAVIASQTYSPPPPPSLPDAVSPEKVSAGKGLFEQNVWTVDHIDTHNYLGPIACGSCHDSKNRLEPKSLAAHYATLRERMNEEITKNSGGSPLPLQGPEMDALVAYLVAHYRLYEHKLSK